MNDTLKGYEVLTGIIGMLAESTGKETVRLKDRSTLYQCVYDLCRQYPEKIFPFEFCRRSGELVSSDVDLCLRNLEDSARLRCQNPDLVVFERTATMQSEFKNAVRPRLEALGVLDSFSTASVKYLTSAD